MQQADPTPEDTTTPPLHAFILKVLYYWSSVSFLRMLTIHVFLIAADVTFFAAIKPYLTGKPVSFENVPLPAAHVVLIIFASFIFYVGLTELAGRSPTFIAKSKAKSEK